MQDPIDQYLPWFTLKHIPLLGNQTAKFLVDTYGKPEILFGLPPSEIKQIRGLSSKTINALINPDPFMEKARIELDLLIKNSIGIITMDHANYPFLLKQIPDPPLVLTYSGEMLTRERELVCISIVGSRTPTDYGLEAATNLSNALSEAGFTIVSGMARGIDTAAHWGALNAKGNTIAVLGCGLGNIYPPENKNLFLKIQNKGTLLSEFALDSPPLAAHFPVRNRIIAGISLGTLVVEAAKKSGSLITARLAAEYNREVFAVPGSIASNKSMGTHELLRQGATLVENASNIIDELKHLIHKDILKPEPHENTTPREKNNSMDKDTDIIDNIIAHYPMHIDAIIETSALSSAKVTTILLDLELSGRIKRHSGNYFSRAKGH